MRSSRFPWVAYIFRLIGGLILFNLIWPSGLEFWDTCLYWAALIMITEAGGHIAAHDRERWRDW